MEDFEKKCYICDETIVGTFEDIFANYTYTKHSKTLLCELLETIITRPLIRSETNLGCANCIHKINKYDFGITIAKQMQRELQNLLEQTEHKYMTSVVPANESINEIEATESLSYCSNGGNDNEISTFIIKQQTKQEIESDNENYIESLIELENIDVDHNISKDENDINNDNDNDEDPEEDVANRFQFIRLPNIDIVECDLKPHMIKDKVKKPRLNNYCVDCKLQLTSRELYRLHRREIHPKPQQSALNDTNETYICDMCGASFRTPSRLKIHIRIHDESNPFKCETCGKKFTQKGALKRHLPIHTGERPYQCEKCGKQFIHYSSFHMHNLAHDDIREKECSVCGLKLRSNSHLNRHMRVHTGAKPHECPKCGQKFAQRYNMNVHLRSHDGINRKRSTYKCEICNEKFTKLYQLNEHKCVYHDVVQTKIESTTPIKKELLEDDNNRNINPYKCEICQQTFQKLNMLAEHNNIYHNNTESSDIYDNVIISTETIY